MNIAVINNGIVENTAVFDSVQSAETMFPERLCVCCDNLSCGKGDLYRDGQFIKSPEAETIDTEACLLDLDFRLMMIEENAKL